MIAALLALVAVSHAQGTGTIKEILIRGNQRVSQEAVLATMRTKSGQPYSQASLDQDKVALEELGFFRAVDIRAEALEGGDWRVVVDVSEYPEIKEIRIVGNTVVTTEQILEAITLKPGDLFNLNASNPSRAAIDKLYQDKGYFGVVTDFAPLPESPNTLNVAIVETTVSSVTVEGNDRTQDRIVKKLIKTRAGDPLNINNWRDDLRRLWSTQWFETVESRQNTPEVGKVDLTAVVKEARTGTFNVGIQFDPRSSLAGFVRVQDSNFRGTGQSVGVELLQSGSGGLSFDLDYGNRFFDNRDTSMTASLYSRVVHRFAGVGFGNDDTPTEDDNYTERRTGASLSFTRPIRKNLYASIGTRFERIETDDLDTTTSTEFIQQDGDVATITFGLTRNTRDVDVEAAFGEYAVLSIQPGWADITEVGGVVSEDLLGKMNFIKSVIEYRRYFTNQPPRPLSDLTEPRRVLAARIRYGRIDGDVPFFEQFFAGGSDTLRGYEEDRFWGKNLIVSSLEYRHPIQKSFNIIGFVDYGGAWGGYDTVGDFSQSDSMDLHLGYGLGVSFRTPLGPIRLDLGFDEDGNSRTHFLIGTSF